MKKMKGKERKRQILRTAQHIFAEQTYHGATTAKIAKAAGVTEPTIYLYFKSKKDLFVAVIEDVSKFVFRATSNILKEDGELMERYIRAFEAYHEYSTRVNPDVSRIWINAVSVNDPDVQAALREFFDRMTGLFLEDIKRTAENRNIGFNHRPEVVAKILVSLSVGQEILNVIGAGEEKDWIPEGVRELLQGWKWGVAKSA